MNNNPLEPLEDQLSRARQPAAPVELRAPVLAAVHRQLAAQGWDRRLARMAAVLLVVGFCLNWTISLRDEGTVRGAIGVASTPEAIVDTAVAVARATDVETGSRIAQHLSALGGTSLSPQQLTAIEQVIQQRVKTGSTSRKDG
jgi:hypothetical protein